MAPNTASQFAARIRAGLPAGVKRTLKPFYLLYLDTLDVVSGHRRAGLPPTRLMLPQYGRRDPAAFKEVGEWFVRDLRDSCGLRPDHRVLDVGCGTGRVAYALSSFLSEQGGYEGFDVDRRYVDWASKHVAPHHPNVNFRLADVANKQYNPDGQCSAARFRFPFDDETFDVCFLHSVFTHMLPEELGHYLSEIHRVLRPNAAAYISYYLFNAEAERLLEQRPDLPMRFEHSFGEYRTISVETPEYSVAYDEEYIRGIYDDHGFEIDEPIRWGDWCGRAGTDRHQDVVIARK